MPAVNGSVFESIAGPEDIDERLDNHLAAASGLTRSRVKALIDSGHALVDGKPSKAGYRLRQGNRVSLTVPPPEPIDAQPEPIALSIVYEDESLLIVDKPRGMVVHPAAGNRAGTLVNALMHHCADLSGIGGKVRPGIVHRIDKDTSGLLMVAKTDQAHHSLSAQVRAHTARRVYRALVEGVVKTDSGTIDLPIGRHRVHRKRMAVTDDGRSAITHYTVLERFEGATLIEARLETGRTHQIRVHMAHIGHPLVGDPVYGFKRSKLSFPGQALHACRLDIEHPVTGRPMAFHAPLPEDFQDLLNKLRARSDHRA